MISVGCLPSTVQPTELNMRKTINHILASTKDFLDGTGHLVSVRTFTEDLSDLNDLVEGDVTTVLN